MKKIEYIYKIMTDISSYFQASTVKIRLHDIFEKKIFFFELLKFY